MRPARGIVRQIGADAGQILNLAPISHFLAASGAKISAKWRSFWRQIWHILVPGAPKSERSGHFLQKMGKCAIFFYLRPELIFNWAASAPTEPGPRSLRVREASADRKSAPAAQLN